MWPEAIRIAKDYLPNELAALQEEFDREQLHSGAKGVESFVAQAKQWEAQGEWERAVGALLKVWKLLQIRLIFELIPDQHRYHK